MNQHSLDKLFSPSSIVVIGASDKPHSVGMKVFYNLLQYNFLGKFYAVNPKHESVQGQRCFAHVAEIDGPIDLAVIATPAVTVPSVIAECGKKNIPFAIVLSSGFSEIGKEGQLLERAMIEAAKSNGLRLVGPNCLGIMRPQRNMNATFDNNSALDGRIALVSQSGAISASILDWAINKKIGFSAIASLGNNADVDFSDVIDFLAQDPYTESILLYIEGVRRPKAFMRALRKAACNKPVIAIKAGRNNQGSRAALSHTGALIGNGDVFDAALRRAGVVRVFKIEDLFSAAEILSGSKKIKGNRLVVITNGGGAGVMAADRASELHVQLPALQNEVIANLNQVLPGQWSHCNPIDMIGDATPERYHQTLEICKNIEEMDAVLAILVPVAMSQPMKVAKQLIKDAKTSEKPVLACWMGERQVKSAWKLFEKYKLPCFDTPEKAIEAFSFLAAHYHNQQLLLQKAALPREIPAIHLEKANQLIASVLASGRNVLTSMESKKLLSLFDVRVTETLLATTEDEAVNAARSCGFPVVMKIHSPDITHKSDVGGVRLNLLTEDQVRAGYHEMLSHVKNKCPSANILGVTIESQYKTPNDREVMIGVVQDVVFGPVISFGAGGTLVEVMRDRALQLPPLNAFLAERLIAETRIAKLLGKFRQMPAASLEKLVTMLLRVSLMISELPAIQEMDINPVIVNDKDAVAVDARIVIQKMDPSFVPYSHLVIDEGC